RLSTTRGAPAPSEPSRAGSPAVAVQRTEQRPARGSVTSDPVAAALSTGLARLGADGAVVFPGLATPTPKPKPAPTPAPTIQRKAVTRESTSPPPTAAVGEAARPTPATRATSAAELDELAARLYDRIRTRMKAELRVDRERAGLVAGPYR
ncbi:MAG: hypothetical protein ACRDZO_09565, partial [Egibacteraceae bacterium]